MSGRRADTRTCPRARDHAHPGGPGRALPAHVTSSIPVAPDLADAVHALAELARRPVDRGFLRTRLATMDAAMDALESALDAPMLDLAGHLRRAFLATTALACTLTRLPAPELAGLRHTTARVLDLLESLGAPANGELRTRLLEHASPATAPTALA